MHCICAWKVQIIQLLAMYYTFYSAFYSGQVDSYKRVCIYYSNYTGVCICVGGANSRKHNIYKVSNNIINITVTHPWVNF